MLLPLNSFEAAYTRRDNERPRSGIVSPFNFVLINDFYTLFSTTIARGGGGGDAKLKGCKLLIGVFCLCEREITVLQIPRQLFGLALAQDAVNISFGIMQSKFYVCLVCAKPRAS